MPPLDLGEGKPASDRIAMAAGMGFDVFFLPSGLRR